MEIINKAIALLQGGEVVILPTETVYGLAADATQDAAVAKIYALKDRPKFNPLIVHIYSIEQAAEIAELSPNAKLLAEKYWPGPLTIVAKKRNKNFAQLASAGLDTIALRIPSHPLTREILKSGLMLAMPSANISGSLSPTKFEHVKKDFPHTYIIDGGACEVGLESTIITFDENDEPIILREGVLQISDQKSKIKNQKIIAPGMLLRHYAPKNRIEINVAKRSADAVFIGFGDVGGDYNLSTCGSLQEAASNLFAMLHDADAKNKKIEVAPIPNIGIGAAINDKLERAARPSEKKHKI